MFKVNHWDLQSNEEGEIIIETDQGNLVVLTKSAMEYIWEAIEIERIREDLLLDKKISNDINLATDEPERLADFFYMEKQQLFEANKEMLLRLALLDLDMDDEEREETEDDVNNKLIEDILS